MIYDFGQGEDKNWILAEGDYREDYLAKCESVMCQGNGYMCIRGAAEEICSEKIGRYTLVAGTFDKLPDDACTELANSADITAADIEINGEKVSPDSRVEGTYSRTLNLKNGLLLRSYQWQGKNGERVLLSFRRVVSLKNKHLAVTAFDIENLGDKSIDIKISTGIDGENIQKSEHTEAVSAECDNGIMCVCTRTCESGILFCTAASVSVSLDCTASECAKGKTAMAEISLELAPECRVSVEKKAVIYTNRDRERDGCSLFCLKDTAGRALLEAEKMSFDDILAESAEEWYERIWSCRSVDIDGADTDQLAVRFALYHLTAMAPVHDNRMNIGAKGLSGPGYYGHAFWDTEIYMLPYFIFAAPNEARSLMEYRYNCLDAAREYAADAGCEGARFPWEAAWITDGEATPVWCETGDLELHITSDVAFGAYYYYIVSGDEDFMDRCGYELIFDCAKFWATKVEYNKKLDRYEISDVIGPNEYKEHVDNNAYTNYFACEIMNIASMYCKRLKEQNPGLYKALDKKLELERFIPMWTEKTEKMYLPRENEDGIIPEDDTFLTLTDVVKDGVSISLDPDVRERMKEAGGYLKSMVCKQADVVALLYMMEDLFSAECKKKNFYFYEQHCLHDSSLSLATFSILASDLGEKEMAYSLFERATMIDIGPDFWTSDPGIHAASLGGIWQCCVFGFGGVRRYGEELRIQPDLPDKWNELHFRIWWNSQCLEITETHESLSVKNLTGTADVQFLYNGKKCSVGNGITIKY